MNQYRIDPSKGLEFGIYTLGDHVPDPKTGKSTSPQERIQQIIEYAKLAEQAGLDFFSVGESHQNYFATQAHTVVLAAIAQATSKIKIGSTATIISTSDPVRVYEDFSTIDLISNGRAEIVAGRASRVGLFDLLGYNVHDYEELFEEKFDLLRLINEQEVVNWSGEFRAPLRNAKVIPRPLNGSLPIWRAVGGSPASAVQAKVTLADEGTLTAPLKQGTKVGTVTYTFKAPGMDQTLEKTVNLITAEDAEKAGWFTLVMRAIGDFFSDLFNGIKNLF